MNVLITGAWAQAKDYMPRIHAAGNTVYFMQQEQDELPCKADEIEGVICNALFMHHNIKDFKNLRFVQLTSTGLDRVPLDYVKKQGIALYNARDVYSIPMAEYALWAVLELYKQGRSFAALQQAQRWEKLRNVRELYGKQVTILGCGNVGTACASRFKALGCKVVGLCRSPEKVAKLPERSSSYDCLCAMDALEETLANTDVLISALPLCEETRGIIGKAQLEKLKEDAVLVNLSRGGIIDESALTDMLKSKPKASAVLDVFEEEPLPKNSELWKLPNVLITPHNSFVGEGNAKRLAKCILGNILSGEDV